VSPVPGPAPTTCAGNCPAWVSVDGTVEPVALYGALSTPLVCERSESTVGSTFARFEECGPAVAVPDEMPVVRVLPTSVPVLVGFERAEVPPAPAVVWVPERPDVLPVPVVVDWFPMPGALLLPTVRSRVCLRWLPSPLKPVCLRWLPSPLKPVVCPSSCLLPWELRNVNLEEKRENGGSHT
jgi:hypothetical protein